MSDVESFSSEEACDVAESAESQPFEKHAYEASEHSSEIFSEWDVDDSDCSTSESGMSNTFLDEVFEGSYEGWTDRHNAWLGRWVSDDRWRSALYALQSFEFLNLPKLLSDSKCDHWKELFAEGAALLNDTLENAEIDIVNQDKRFPDGVYHNIDQPHWTESINNIYSLLNYMQGSNVDCHHFFIAWVDHITAAIELLSMQLTREKFESVERVTWVEPNLDSVEAYSGESRSK